jgi:hypothetical protein
MRAAADIYGGRGPLDAPAYTLVAAYLLRLPATTVGCWALGRDQYKPVIAVADPAGSSCPSGTWSSFTC